MQTGKEAIPETGDNEYNPSAPEGGYRQNEHLPPSEIAAPVGTRAELRCSVQSRSTPLIFLAKQVSLTIHFRFKRCLRDLEQSRQLVSTGRGLR